jgi:hypothetical protein
MNIAIVIAFIGAVVGVAYLLKMYKGKRRAKQNPLTYSVDIPESCYDNGVVMDSGLIIRPYIPVSVDAQLLIEAGIAHTIRNTLGLWGIGTPFSNLAEWQVFLVPPDTHNVETDPGSPALLVKALDPSGNLYQVQAAGTCMGVDGGLLGLQDPRTPAIILPYEESQLPAHAVYLEESARNEAEHIRMWANNKSMYFNYTGANDQHPIFEDAT